MHFAGGHPAKHKLPVAHAQTARRQGWTRAAPQATHPRRTSPPAGLRDAVDAASWLVRAAQQRTLDVGVGPG
ncbi:hypothetical protein BD309DRAFT_992953 [Dichomitus squalens]|uniref:Uncharacterized protein n=2 Tax=Dichomitus squalens TaxID=114155 RepID=A0A4Q9Q3N7_9APHY|nr:uncharacterized protein DICSQDRAFT_137418 [Dichomitus squalens LYAD-421 SS1]EJF60610.1 hypothetical protein DICSQDRAFT_137418 [Dichomitus squalens LYAD-421 SS1]TBU30066.1 hypothetical protein BD311DRAFT_659661 [Dichomitus squalens]TBU40641.1 hypothetical protein BD309DRAFT_992953 [Dichomitus squalens]TBU61516.1 hypothetical protein BD310DRAFT_813171 [Dichomitus squalens]